MVQRRPKLTKKHNSKWEVTSPVEKSAYLFDDADPIVLDPSALIVDDDLLMVDLFCGCGGFSVGFHKAGFKTVLANDHLKPACETFAYNHPEAHVILGDIRKVKSVLIEQILNGRHVHVVTAGVPCQGFSLMNRKHWDEDERNFLFKEFIRMVNIIKPDVVLLENVTGLRKTANGAFERAIKDAIAESGYNVSFKVLNAADYGVPQFRERVLFLGFKEGESILWPKPTHGTGREKYVTAVEAIGDLPPLEASQSAFEYVLDPMTEYQKTMRGDCTKLLNHEAPNHDPEVVDMIKNTLPGAPMYDNFKQRIRLHPDRPSPTQVAGGIRPQFQFGHYSQARGLTIRERCRIQSFPDNFKVFGGIVQGRVQTGNAVPPLLAYAIAQSIAKYLKGEEIRDVLTPEPKQLSLLPSDDGTIYAKIVS